MLLEELRRIVGSDLSGGENGLDYGCANKPYRYPADSFGWRLKGFLL